MKALGYVIVNSDGLIFASYKHPGTQKVGHPVWVKTLVDENYPGKAAIYSNLKDAADIACSIFMRDSVRCSAKPVGFLGSDHE